MKRVIISILIMVFILLLVSNVAVAINSEPSSLTVIMKYNEESLSGINIAICRVADVTENNKQFTYNATKEFVGAGVDFSDLSKEKNISLAVILNAYAYNNNIGRISQKTISNGTATFRDLFAGLYLVAQINAESSEYIIAPYLVSVPVFNESKSKLEYDVMAYPKTEPIKKDEEITSVSVHKVWVGTNNTPSDILVHLYCNGTPHGNSIMLNADNYWSYTWTDLDPNNKWTVDELNVPDGFIKTISGSASTGFIITNTKEISSSGRTVISESPKTSDESNIQLWVTLITFGAIGLFSMILILFLIMRKRKCDEKF